MKRRRIRLWLLWQSACLADALLHLRRRVHYWYVGPPGRHSLDTGQMAAIETDLAGRPWPLEPAPALLSLHPPAPGPELFHHEHERLADDSFIAGIADALLRATSPHLYQDHDTYWQGAWEDFRDFYVWEARETAAWNQLRRECGLPEREPPAIPPRAAICQAA